MLPCTGVDGVCGPLCTYKETMDGTYTLADIQKFHYAIDELIFYANEAANRAT